ncbi:MAG: hypothetical protein ACLP8B_27435 [Xanthobacteraceae bacterium]
MKNAYPLLDVSRRKPKKQKKQKIETTANIEQRYKELLRLRAEVCEVEESRNPR